MFGFCNPLITWLLYLFIYLKISSDWFYTFFASLFCSSWSIGLFSTSILFLYNNKWIALSAKLGWGCPLQIGPAHVKIELAHFQIGLVHEIELAHFLIGFVHSWNECLHYNCAHSVLYEKFWNNIIYITFQYPKKISTKRDKSKGIVWCWSCDECQNNPFLCLVCNNIITFRERHDHMHIHFNDPNQYLVCRMCKLNKHITHFRFKLFICWLCTYLSRYRFIRTKERFVEYAKKYSIEV